MAASEKLNGRRIAVLAADGFEQIEVTVPVTALRAAGAEVEIISLREGRIRGVNLHEPARRLKVDRVVSQANPDAYDGLFIPGGFISPDLLRQSREARDFVRAFDVARKPIAAICHGPWLLASAGLLKGRCLASWPGVRDDMVNAGGVWLDQEVVRDGNWVTSRGPEDLGAFVTTILELYTHSAPVRMERPQSVQSSPQRAEPPQLIIGAMKWLPRPSLRTGVFVGALAAGAVLASRRGLLPGVDRNANLKQENESAA